MRIVLADPGRTVQEVFRSVLTAAGHEVVAFDDGPEAIRHLKSDNLASGLITGMHLPSLSGFEVCWEARLTANGKRPPYILVTSSGDERRNRPEMLDCGADDFMMNPPDPRDLYARLRAAERRIQVHNELVQQATTDGLTGVLNRRAFFEHATETCLRARSGAPIGAALMDIDGLKQINDALGHQAGDLAICAVANAAASGATIVGRLGGDEFGLLFEQHTLAKVFWKMEVFAR